MTSRIRSRSSIVGLSCILMVCSLLLSAVPTAYGANLLTNSNFTDGQVVPWETLFLPPAAGSAAVVNGELCLNITAAGGERWQVQARQTVVLQADHTYNISFKAYANKPTQLYAKVGNSGAPYAEFWNNNWQPFSLTTTKETFTGSFTMKGDAAVKNEFAFHLGGNLVTSGAPVTICLDDIVLDDPEFNPEPEPEPEPLPDVRLNQVGYVPISVKRATIVSAATRPVSWELVNTDGNVVASGRTTVFGQDAASGDHVHIADFSTFRQPGTGYTLWVGDEASHPFDINTNIYDNLKTEALRYFYHNRSGIEIKAEHVGEAYARPAGHIGVAPNKGDTAVTCAPDVPCNYTLDVSGGWYDAGDHGKYVVNGGISAWTLMNQYERTLHLRGSMTALADGTLNIPESGNGIPDILDEARWEVEFFLKMQVPEGLEKAGMVHHKIHDATWTGLPLPPDQDPRDRFLRPPSTAATLNMAATAAQAARIWKQLDPAFAAKALAAAERAWQAAVANPAVYAPGSDGTGGGPYNDNNVTDEFYWAAAELFVTTGQDAYRTFITQSPHYLKVPTGFGANSEPAMAWATTQALGTISLAVVPNTLANDQVTAARSSITAAADVFVQQHTQQGYGLPFAPGDDGKYPWGSNSFVLNNMIIMALAHDFTNNDTYLNAVREAMDYLLGRNAMDKSYVSGYGENPLMNPHHRFWAKQLDPSFPGPPPGTVSGGPNSSIQDPYASPRLQGCAPQKCYIDHIESWSTNEITVNWNAPFAWVAAFLDEHAGYTVYLPLVLQAIRPQ